MRSSAPLVMVGLLVSGCASIGPAPEQTSAPPVASDTWVNPIIIDHEHSDLSLHNITNNVTLVGHDYITPNGPPGGLGEIDVGDHYAFVATFGHGFTILDIGDPANPVVMSITEIPTPASPVYGKYTADLKVSPDGNWVFLAMEVSATPGVLIYDARDKAAPKLAGFWAAPGLLLGCHMVEYAVISEQEWLFCAPLDNALYVGLLQPADAAGIREVVTVARWVPNSPKFVQEQMARIQADPRAWAESQVSGHQDMTFQLDPLTGAPTLYVSFWNLGLRIVDVSIPAVPLEIGGWDGEGSSAYGGALHTSMAFNSDDRRIVVSIPEGADPPALFVLDWTDLANPIVLTEWWPRDDFGNYSASFSMHNFQIVDGRVYLAMYHGGLWVLDLSTPERQAAPYALGTYLPHEPRPDGQPYGVGVWDVVVWHGYMLTADSNSGFYVLQYTGDLAGDEATTSFA